MKIRLYYVSVSISHFRDESILFVSKEFGIMEYYNLDEGESIKDISSPLHFASWKDFYATFPNFDKFHQLTYLGEL